VTLKLQNASTSAAPSFSHKTQESTWRQNSNNPEPGISERKPPQLRYLIVKSRVTCHYRKIRHFTLTALNILATQTIGDLASRCSSELWFWFFLLPAAQHGWSVSHCALDTRTLGRQPICNRCRRESSCPFLTTDTWPRLILHLDAIVRQMFKFQRRLCGSVFCTTCCILVM